jgi:hypothetical protein
MALTRANAEVMLIDRCGKKMTAAGMDGTTVTGINADINQPLATALIGMGLTPVNLMDIADADLAAVEDIPQLLDRAELRLLESIAGNLDLVDITVGPRREALSQLYDQVNKSIQRMTDKIASLYGGMSTGLSAGVVTLDFQETFDE